MKHISEIGVTVLIFLLCAPNVRAADASAFQDMLAKVVALEAEKEKMTAHETYRVDMVTVIRDASGKIERQVESERKITRQGKDPDKVEFKEMKVNGKMLSQKEMETELGSSNRGLEGKLPFSEGEPQKYIFEPGGTTTCAGFSAWLVSFHPKTPDKDLAVGKIYINQENYNPIRMDFATSVLPSGVQSMDAVMNFRPQNRLWLPTDLEINMQIKVTFLITLADKQINIKENFYDYRTPSTAQQP